MTIHGDVALVNANIRTIDSRDSTAQAVLMSGGSITAVGTDAEIRGKAATGTEIIDVGGRTVVPGFIDAHNHLAIAAFSPDALDASDPSIASIADLLEAVERHCAQLPPGQWVIGMGFLSFALSEQRGPTRFELDEVSPHNPFFLIDVSCHAGWANSLALTAVSIDADTPQPWGGVIVKDHRGEPTGELLEAAINLVQSAAWSGHAERDWDRSVALLESKLNEYLTLGITAIGDALVTPRYAELYRRANEANRLPLTVQQLHGGEDFFSQQVLGPKSLTDRIMASESNMLRGRAIKIFADRAYPDGPAIDEIHDGCTTHVGTSFYSESEILELLTHATSLGMAPVVHAMGNRSMDHVLNAYEAVRRAGSELPLRLEHAFVADERQAARMAELNVDLVVNPGVLLHAGEFISSWRGAGQSQLRVIPVGSLIDAGVRVSLASDHPCGPLSPAEIMWAAVTRETVHGSRVDPDEAITAAQALRLYTANAAAASGRSDEEGSIETGKRGNLLVLDRDPLICPTDDLKDMRVDKVYVDGRLAHSTEE